MDKSEFVKKEEYDKLKEENEKLKNKLKKLDSRLNTIIKMNDKTFKTIINKNNFLEKYTSRFNRILQQSDRQGKSILIKKEEQEQILRDKAKMAAMGEMIDNIAHQWRQPLNIIAMQVQNISLKYIQNTLDDNLMDRFNEDVLKQIEYMSRTIDDFRNFLKEDKTLKYLDINKTIQKIEVLTKHIVSQNNITLIISRQNTTDKVYGIENELIQVFMNLISNSKDAFSKDQNKRVIIIDLKTGGSDILISFKDNAGGIKEDILNKVFKPKFTTKEDSGGSGIGLAMSKKIIENTFKGTMEVKNDNFKYEDKKYKGALFTITLPAAS